MAWLQDDHPNHPGARQKPETKVTSRISYKSNFADDGSVAPIGVPTRDIRRVKKPFGYDYEYYSQMSEHTLRSSISQCLGMVSEDDKISFQIRDETIRK